MKKKNNRGLAIIAVIALLVLGYYFWHSPTETPVDQNGTTPSTPGMYLGGGGGGGSSSGGSSGGGSSGGSDGATPTPDVPTPTTSASCGYITILPNEFGMLPATQKKCEGTCKTGSECKVVAHTGSPSTCECVATPVPEPCGYHYDLSVRLFSKTCGGACDSGKTCKEVTNLATKNQCLCVADSTPDMDNDGITDNSRLISECSRDTDCNKCANPTYDKCDAGKCVCEAPTDTSITPVRTLSPECSRDTDCNKCANPTYDKCNAEKCVCEAPTDTSITPVRTLSPECSRDTDCNKCANPTYDKCSAGVCVCAAPTTSYLIR